MATISQKYPSEGGINFSDPNKFKCAVIGRGAINLYADAGALYTSSVADFFTNMAYAGTTVDTDWTADTWKEVLDVTSGSGLMLGAGGPAGLAGTPSTTYEIRVDDVVYELDPIVATTTGQRAVLGPFMPAASFTSANVWGAFAGGVDAAKRVYGPYNSNMQIPSWDFADVIGTPCLKFERNLRVRIKTSENNSTTTNRERSCWVQWRRFT